MARHIWASHWGVPGSGPSQGPHHHSFPVTLDTEPHGSHHYYISVTADKEFQGFVSAFYWFKKTIPGPKPDIQSNKSAKK